MLPFLVLFLPLLSCLTCAFFIKLRESIIIQGFSIILVGFASFFSWIIFLSLSSGDQYIYHIFDWIALENFRSHFSISVDALTATMFVVVTTVSFVVHWYSMGYMSEDPSKLRFFCYLSLFTFAMLVLVAAEDLLQLFLGWEGVGVCSYLLIGFWFQKESANLASMKAFIMNRVGDLAFIVALFALYSVFGSLSFNSILANLAHHNEAKILGINAFEFISIALFIGCMSKSAQLGLHTWLPDAMEGPTPVSALIHAATMVTAGVFLVVKMSPLFELAVCTRKIMLVIGISTALFGCMVAIFQDDIKKIIAYSTCSQLGYMFAACGASAYNVALFHLATHAFFKALLFLCSGNVIHALHGEQNINNMGGLRSKLRSTYVMMLIGSFALCGIFPLAGFYSKDLIIASVHGNQLGQGILIIGAFCTAVYSMRLVKKVFILYPENCDIKVHKPSFSMVIPLLPLCVFSVIAGYLGSNIFFADGFWIGTGVVVTPPYHETGINPLKPMIFSVLGFLMVCAYYKYSSRSDSGGIMRKALYVFPLIALILNFRMAVILLVCVIVSSIVDPAHRFMKFIAGVLSRKLYFDEIYECLFLKNVKKMAHFLWRVVDCKIVDGTSSFVVRSVRGFSEFILYRNSGMLYDYVFAFIFGIVLMFWMLSKMI